MVLRSPICVASGPSTGQYSAVFIILLLTTGLIFIPVCCHWTDFSLSVWSYKLPLPRMFVQLFICPEPLSIWPGTKRVLHWMAAANSYSRETMSLSLMPLVYSWFWRLFMISKDLGVGRSVWCVYKHWSLCFIPLGCPWHCSDQWGNH